MLPRDVVVGGVDVDNVVILDEDEGEDETITGMGDDEVAVGGDEVKFFAPFGSSLSGDKFLAKLFTHSFGEVEEDLDKRWFILKDNRDDLIEPLPLPLEVVRLTVLPVALEPVFNSL